MDNNLTICLNMIVKDESHIIEKTLNNLCEYFNFSYYLISDTGSSDNTIEIIKQFFNNKNINGEVIKNEWKNFEYNRNLALDAAKDKADYSLIFDADDFIHSSPDVFQVPHNLTADGYTFTFKGGGATYNRTLLISNKKNWRWIGVVHEVLTCKDIPHTILQITGNYYIESGRIGARNKDPLKYQKDALLLEQAIKDPETDPSLVGRYAFYCGQSWKDFNSYKKSIYWYRKVVLEYNNWSEEKYYACVKIGELYEHLKKTDKALFWYLLSNQYNPKRMEGICSAARIMLHNKMYQYAEKCLLNSWEYCDNNYPLKDFLFATDDMYLYEYLSLVARASYYSKNTDLCFKSIYKLFERSKELNISQISTELMNLQFYVPLFSNKQKYELYDLVLYCIKRVVKEKDCINAKGILQHCDKYFTNLVEQVVSNNEFTQTIDKIENIKKKLTLTLKNSNKKNFGAYNVILTMTTCKRYDLFEKTMNSILYNWNDVLDIDKFIIIDDNSSEEDKRLMIKNYPFIDMFEKDEDEKGHRASMNMIWNILKTLKPKYWVHLEDDWLFIKQDSYINKAINAIENLKDKNVNQILYNKGYGEIISDLSVPIGEIVLENNKLDMFDNILLHIQNQKLPVSSCSYWWHYSFRPSLIKTDVILELGNYDSENTFFELDYAKRYVAAGYKSAYYSDITSLHIGRLSGSRANNEVSNAYNLNNIDQFNNSNIHFIQKEKQHEVKIKEKINISDILPNNINYQDINEDFIFIKGYDIIHNDFFYNNTQTIDNKMQLCLMNKGCIAFNSLGFFKNDIDKLQVSQYFSENDGVYILKKYLNLDK